MYTIKTEGHLVRSVKDKKVAVASAYMRIPLTTLNSQGVASGEAGGEPVFRAIRSNP